MFRLYLGGYKPVKILSCSLEVLLAKQNHTEEGKTKLAGLYPELRKAAIELSDMRKERAMLQCDEMVQAAALTPSKLIDRVTAKSWNVGGYGYFGVIGDVHE
jgi:hypothetical protein